MIESDFTSNAGCLAELILKIVSGKWKPMIIRLAAGGGLCVLIPC